MVIWSLRAGESDGCRLTELGVHQVEVAASAALARHHVRLTAIRRGAERDAWHAGRQVKRLLAQFNVEQVVAEELTSPSCLPGACVCGEVARMVRPDRAETVAHWLHCDPEALQRRTRVLVMLHELADQMLHGSHVLLVESGQGHPVIELAVPDELAGCFPRLAHGEMVRCQARLDESGFRFTEVTRLPCPLAPTAAV